MAKSISIEVIIAIGGVGGVVIVVGICILLIRLITKRKHNRKMARISLDGEGGLSRAASSHMNITDADIVRMPGTNAALQRSLQDRYNNAPHEPTLLREPRPVQKKLERVKRSKWADREAVVPLQPWPLPRRLTRSDGSPHSNLQTLPSTPTRKGNHVNASRQSSEQVSGMSSGKHIQPASLETVPNGTDNNTSPGVGLKPKPLFHGKQRSVSQGIISRLELGSEDIAGLYVVETKVPKTEPPRRSRHPRSASLCSQEPGAAPVHILPALPLEAAEKQRKQGIKSPTDFSACGSLFSENTSILDNETTKAIPYEIDTTSIPQISWFVSVPASEPPKEGLGIWDNAELKEKASPASTAKALKTRPQMSSQKSFRASIQKSLAKGTHRDLPVSSLDQTSHNISGNDPANERINVVVRLKIWSPRSASKRESYQKSMPTSESLKETTQKRASVSVLCPISGNEGVLVLNPIRKRSSSIATDDPFEWSKQISGIPKDREDESKHQNRIRISKIPVRKPSPTPCRIAEGGSPIEDGCPNTVVRRQENREASVRPPSQVDFDLHFASSHHRLSQMAPTPPFSPTLAMLNQYGSRNTCPEFAISTPTKKPSRRTSTTNRLSIFDNPFTTAWRPPSQVNESTTDLQEDTNTSKQANHNHLDPTAKDPDSRPPSFLYDFPFPPKRFSNGSRLPYPSWRAPKTPIRGPRAPPHTFHIRTSPPRRWSRSPSRSPTRSPARISKSYSNNPNFDLRNSIMTLRRQNSEVNNHQSKRSREHKRYLSIGDVSDGESAVFEDVDAGKENERGDVHGRMGGEVGDGLMGSKTMPGFGKSRGYESPTKGGMRSGRRLTFVEGQPQGIF